MHNAIPLSLAALMAISSLNGYAEKTDDWLAGGRHSNSQFPLQR
jgi:hypothetical protein